MIEPRAGSTPNRPRYVPTGGRARSGRRRIREVSMPRYLIQRNFGERGDDEMGEIGRDSKRIIVEHTPEIVWEISHVVADDDGNITTFCIYQAPDEDAILKHASLLGRH